MDVLSAVDSVDDLLHKARPVPFTEQVQVDRKELTEAVELIGDALPSPPIGRTSEAAEFTQNLDLLSELVAEMRSIPLTGRHRIDRDAAYGLLDNMRATLPAYVKEARWREAAQERRKP